MKIKIYAISLLLSFLVVLSHEMIPHHHDDLALIYSVTHENDDGHEHKHDSQKEEKSTKHSHSFPIHQHLTASNDVYIERTRLLESNIQFRHFSFFVCAQLVRSDLSRPPNLEGKLYEEPTFLISSICSLEVFALRGPPVIV